MAASVLCVKLECGSSASACFVFGLGVRKFFLPLVQQIRRKDGARDLSA
jgi:hypothetical protein